MINVEKRLKKTIRKQIKKGLKTIDGSLEFSIGMLKHIEDVEREEDGCPSLSKEAFGKMKRVLEDMVNRNEQAKEELKMIYLKNK